MRTVRRHAPFKKQGQIKPTPPSLVTLTFRNGLEYRNADGYAGSGDVEIW